jgi:hypothetical protein
MARVPEVGLLLTVTCVVAVVLLPISVAVTVHILPTEGAVKRPEASMVPQDVVQVTPTDAENCSVSLTTTVGFCGSIESVDDPLDPVPERETVCGLLLAVSVKVSVAVLVPASEGLNAMLTVQLAEAARLAAQV